MNSKRIGVSLLHTWYHAQHSMETWVDIFWNSALQMVVFAFIAVAFANQQNPMLGMYMVAGLVFWNVIWAAQYGLTVGVLWEIWSKSFSNMFITPLTFEEFIVGQALSSVVKGIASVLVSAAIGGLIFHFSLAVFGWYIVIYFLELFCFGLAAGMFVLSLIFRFGVDVQSFSWSIVFLVQPFGAVFYPVSVLPEQIRWIAYGIPTTYVFEALRGQMLTGNVDLSYLWTATWLNGIYFLVSYAILHGTYVASKKSGAFARLEG